jgi:hypothetical protein
MNAPRCLWIGIAIGLPLSLACWAGLIIGVARLLGWIER